MEQPPAPAPAPALKNTRPESTLPPDPTPVCSLGCVAAQVEALQAAADALPEHLQDAARLEEMVRQKQALLSQVGRAWGVARGEAC